MNRTGEKTAIRDRHRRAIARDKPPCHICGNEIDYTLPHLDPGQFVVDHIVPLNRDGTDTLDNKAAAHRWCNRQKSDRVDWQQPRQPTQPPAPPRTFVTHRTWTP